ncbi:PspA/IM30 family protein [Oceanobacillus alkalisoli]|uniref:PspA/IM30 family protein n=1 Tax=Oceanobacillus alkalisoli TaxID=2925113 RepID=UPI001EE48F18|nr:PspA/IM30 family protein [Oceanobacillus alkalisoli]MCG5105248.1 PspA/IM30 family protein [Oceanobacillus alkalisoli]
MGIISRFTTLMKANINSIIDRSRDPQKVIQKTLRDVNLDLRTVQSEVNALEADVRRAKRAVDECELEIRKLERYRERAADRNEAQAIGFLNDQEHLENKKVELIGKYNRVLIEARQMRLLEEKLTLDIRQLEARSQTVKEKTALLNQKQKINSGDSSIATGFMSYEEELNFKLDEAEALEQLRNKSASIDSIDEEIVKLTTNKSQTSNE